MTLPRIESAEHGHHITAHAAGRRFIIVTSTCADAYLEAFGEVTIQRGWICITYSVMGNHVHAVCWTPRADLGPGMKVVQESFARWANERDGLRVRGHFWKGRYDNRLIVSEDHAAAVMRYVARQPEHHRIGTMAEWKPAAHLALLGEAPCPEWLRRDRALDLVGGVEAYAALAAKDDPTLVAELLEAFGPAEGVRRAMDVHGIPAATVVRIAGISERTLYRRLRDGRDAHRMAAAAGLPLVRG